MLKIATIAQSDGFRGGGVKQYETEVSIDDLPADAGLKPGMSAEVKILINTLKDALTVPVSAVAEFEGVRVCYIAPLGEAVERREVTVGENNDQYVEILSGVKPGEPVALDARTRAATDMKAAKSIGGVENKSAANGANTSERKP